MVTPGGAEHPQHEAQRMAMQAEAGPTPSPPPFGTVTFLFSDIEGSTERWEGEPQAMELALARHDALMRSAIEAQGGYVFKTMGDEFCAVFPIATDAIAAALDAQRALAAEDFSAVEGLRVRMALHTGQSAERDGDYFGPTVNRVARLVAIAHGEQVIVSGATAELLGERLPQQAQLRDLGKHRLKDLIEPEHVWQLTAAGLPDLFPPLRSLGSLPNNLPRQLTPLIGREDVLAEVEPLVREHPLVSLVGAGGVGKTRVALQVGADLLDGSGDGVWFIDLAPLSDPGLVVGTIASALGLREQPEQPIFDVLLRYLRPRRLLLILDNCEHVVEEAARIADVILRAAPQVRMLTTSREPLRIEGEHVYQTPPLTVPQAAEPLTADQALKYGAIALFAQRAVAADIRFKLTAENAPIVAGICRRLDGIALAIELAAARINLFSLPAIAERLNDRFRILTGGGRTALARQQTMRATIDWSYDLLAAKEQRVFERLSVFAGGCTLDTAVAVCADQDVPNDDLFDVLSSLVNKSLVVVDLNASEPRYGLLESFRQYAGEKLVARDERNAVAHRHALASLELARRFEHAYEFEPDKVWRPLALAELNNWRTALQWALIERGDLLLGQLLTGELGRLWSLFLRDGRRWLPVAINSTDEHTPADVVAKLNLARAQVADAEGENEIKLSSSRAAIARYETVGDAFGKGCAQLLAGTAVANLGRLAEARQLLHEALAVRSLGEGRLVGNILKNLGAISGIEGDFASARSYLADALQSASALQHDLRIADCMEELSSTEVLAGNTELAFEYATRALATLRESDATPPKLIPSLLTDASATLLLLGRYDEAEGYAREALALSRDLRLKVLLEISLRHLAVVAAFRQEEAEPKERSRRKAARLMGFMEAHAASRTRWWSWFRTHPDFQQFERAQLLLRDAFGSDAFAEHMASGAAMTDDEAVEEALSI